MIAISEFKISRLAERFLFFLWPYVLGEIAFLIGCVLVVVACWYLPYESLDQAKHMAILLIIGSTLIGISIGIVWKYGIEERKELWRSVKVQIVMMLQTVFPWPLSKEDWQIIHWTRRACAFIMLLLGVAFLHELYQWNFSPDLYNFIRISPTEKYFLLFVVISPLSGLGLFLLPDAIKLCRYINNRKKI